MVSPTSGATKQAAPPLQPVVSTSPAGHVFNTRPVNTTSSVQTFTVTNTGKAALQITAVTETGAGFKVTSTTCAGMSVAVGRTCTLGVSFTPTSVGSFAGVVRLQDNAANSPQSINVSGKGVATWAQT